MKDYNERLNLHVKSIDKLQKKKMDELKDDDPLLNTDDEDEDFEPDEDDDDDDEDFVPEGNFINQYLKRKLADHFYLELKFL